MSQTTAPAGRLTDPTRPLTFTFDGRDVAAVAGQSVAAALFAAGVRVFSRSFKYHRPRGLFCVAGDCPNCLMEVDGRPNVRTCVEPARQGAVVRHQNAWPSLGFDLLRTFDHFDRWLPVGFYYRSFHKPRWMWPVFEHTLRHLAGLGRVDLDGAAEVAAEVEHVHCDACVIGAGPAGLAAATQAAAAGASVLLLERMPRPGGHLLHESETLDVADGLVQSLRDQSRARLLCDATAFGLYEGNLVGAVQGNRLLKIRAKQALVCTGARQRPFVFHNNDLPGVMLGDGALRLAWLHGVTPGQRAVVLTDHDGGESLAEQLRLVGVEVAAVVDVRPRRGDRAKKAHDWQHLQGSTAVAALGNKRLKGVRVADAKGVTQDVACDLLCFASAPVPAGELLTQTGARYRSDAGRWVLERLGPGLLAAGRAAGTFDAERELVEGRLRGAEAAAAAGYRTTEIAELRRAWDARRGPALVAAYESYLPQPSERERKRFVCLCDDVTEKDLQRAVAEGFDHVETLKRYATVSMGPCQGKVCSHLVSEACARLTGRDVNTIGATTSRPPAVPVELGVLAAEMRHHPVRRTPMHPWHQDHGAAWMDAGQWKRPESYGDVTAEVKAVRTAVGLIDVSTLGKIELIGRDAAELLERVTVNRWVDLKIGRLRYSVMCSEDGIVFDDGVAARVGPEHFYLTATTGNAEGVWQWLELWKATWGLDVTILNHTSANAAMNLAGPKARAVLGRLTSLDLSPEAFPYLAARQADVAGVPCQLLRIGFVGESGYEIHCPAGCGLHLWEALVAAGAQPFGVEAQRVLRLEKGHLIVGVDTDALSNPLDAGLGGLVRFDKLLFHGREPLLRLRAMPPRARLVGFAMQETHRVPPEGCQVVENGKPAGRVTSARFSPTLGRSIGLAWVPASAAEPGTRFVIRTDGGDVAAVVTPTPFYDSEGRRLRG